MKFLAEGPPASILGGLYAPKSGDVTLILVGLGILAVGFFILRGVVRSIRGDRERRKSEPEWKPSHGAEFALILLLILGAGAVLLGLFVAGCGTLFVFLG